LDALNIRPDGVYLDCTLGGGGHSAAIIDKLIDGRLIGIDRDGEAIAEASARITALLSQRDGKLPRFDVVCGNFHNSVSLLDAIGVTGIHGAIIDLGVSSRQLDDPLRGFSYHQDAPLDMRMDASQRLTARDIINNWDERDIARILREFGEEKWAAHIARVVRDRRRARPIETTGQLVSIIDASIPKQMREKDGSHPARRSFQALRIAVNDELAPLARSLEDVVGLLHPGGRLAVIAFHSLEDRIVKNTFRKLADPCTCPKRFPMCVCNKKPEISLINRKPIRASQCEIEKNPRSRSAALRVAEKLDSNAV
jgi:16S rRNA (cytosine1402-N4)-methyltransferase